MGDALRAYRLRDDKPLAGLLSMLVEDTVHSTLDDAPLINAALGITIRGAGLSRHRGGMFGFWKRLVDHYRSLGGELRVGCRVERITGYEKGLPVFKRKINEQEELDPFSDEQALVVNVEGKGLVIIGGCCHPGIVNMTKYAQKLTGVSRVAAIIGGFHLTAGGDDLINGTINGLKEINPGLVLAGHCTGFRPSPAGMAPTPSWSAAWGQ
jgi:hypothetical protein